METERDYYSILQVNRSASEEAIEKAYERLARIYDPATSRKPKAALRWQEISEAYEVLSDKKSRSEYDRRGAKKKAGPAQKPVAAAKGTVAAKGTAATRSGRRPRPEEEEAESALSQFLAKPQFLVGITGGVVIVILVAVLIAVLAGGSGSNAIVSQPTASTTVTPATPTPVGQTPAPGGPDSPPAVTAPEVTTPSGLKYQDIQEGTGASPQKGQKVTVNYTGWLESNGTKFDSSLDRAQPFTFTLGQGEVIPAWDEGVASMKVGGTRRLTAPPALAYGANGRPPTIPANATLIFDVDLLSVQ